MAKNNKSSLYMAGSAGVSTLVQIGMITWPQAKVLCGGPRRSTRLLPLY